MGTTEPIRNEKELDKFVNYYLNEKSRPRNYCLIVMGLNTILRISDILELKWKDVYDYNNNRINNYIYVVERKTQKQQKIIINQNLKSALLRYFYSMNTPPDKSDFIFSTIQHPNNHISRIQAYRIIKEAADKSISDSSHISCHSLRKTFGYHAWKQGAQPVLLMDIYNHSSYQITKRYLGINQDEKDALFLNISF